MFYEVHVLDGYYRCEADDCLTPGDPELIERVYRGEDEEHGYVIMHAADWKVCDAASHTIEAELEAAL